MVSLRLLVDTDSPLSEPSQFTYMSILSVTKHIVQSHPSHEVPRRTLGRGSLLLMYECVGQRYQAVLCRDRLLLHRSGWSLLLHIWGLRWMSISRLIKSSYESRYRLTHVSNQHVLFGCILTNTVSINLQRGICQCCLISLTQLPIRHERIWGYLQTDLANAKSFVERH